MNDRYMAREKDNVPLIGLIEIAPIRQVLLHWVEIRDMNVMPRRRDLDPTAFPTALSLAWMYERLDDGSYICRLSGEQINEAYGRSIAGEMASNLWSRDEYDRIRERYDFILGRPGITYSRTEPDQSDGERARRLSLPLCDNAGVARFVFGVTHYVPVRYAKRGKVGIAANWVRVFHAETLEPIDAPFAPAGMLGGVRTANAEGDRAS